MTPRPSLCVTAAAPRRRPPQYVMSRWPKVKMYRVWGRCHQPTRPAASQAEQAGGLLVRIDLLVQPRQPARQPVDGGLGLGMIVHEVGQPGGQPGQRDL